MLLSMTHLGAAAALSCLLLLPIPLNAGDRFSAIAKEIGKVAQRNGVEKVQILPFVSPEGESGPEGRAIASRIMTEIVEQGRVLVVDGELPAGIPDPYAQAMGSKRKSGVRPEADAVILGGYGSFGRDIRMDIRLLRLRDRVVLYSANKKINNEWPLEETSMAMLNLRPRSSAQRERVESAAYMVRDAASEREAATQDLKLQIPRPPRESGGEETNCAVASLELDQLQSSIMDIKARYLGRKLYAAGLTVEDQPPSLIQDPLIQEQFDIALTRYMRSGKIPALTRAETNTLLVVDGKSFDIHRRCFGEQP